MMDAMILSYSIVSSYSFPVPVNRKKPGRMGELRSGRMIYEFITMTDDALATVAYRFTHIVKADIKNVYPSVYTQPCLGYSWQANNPTWRQGQESP